MQIIDPESYNMLFGRMRALPPSTRHIVMVTTVPVVYPQVNALLCFTINDCCVPSVDSHMSLVLSGTISCSFSDDVIAVFYHRLFTST